MKEVLEKLMYGNLWLIGFLASLVGAATFAGVIVNAVGPALVPVTLIESIAICGLCSGVVTIGVAMMYWGGKKFNEKDIQFASKMKRLLRGIGRVLKISGLNRTESMEQNQDMESIVDQISITEQDQDMESIVDQISITEQDQDMESPKSTTENKQNTVRKTSTIEEVKNVSFDRVDVNNSIA